MEKSENSNYNDRLITMCIYGKQWNYEREHAVLFYSFKTR